MPQRNQHPHSALQEALRKSFPLDARRLAVLSALVLAIIQARSVVLYTLKNHVHLPGTREMRYQRLRRFVQYQLPDELFPRFILSLLPPGDLWLILDRTNWKFGQSDINILLLSAVWNGFSFPLIWTLLPHSGNSNQTQRQKLIEQLIQLRSDRRIAGVLADREFIGEDWFKFLKDHKIAPCIRIRADNKVDGSPVKAYFCNMRTGEMRVWHRPMHVFGVKLRVLAFKCQDGEMLFLAYQGRPKQNLARYARRWEAENLHAALKSRGFNLEDTGLKIATRVSTLLLAVSLAFIWSCLTGEIEAARQRVKRKKHGYNEISVFRLGLDTLQDLLLHASSALRHAVCTLMPGNRERVPS